MHIIYTTTRLQLYYTIYKKIQCSINGIQSRTSTVDLAYKVYGPSPTSSSIPIFVLHGILGSKRNWDSMCKEITKSTNNTLIAADARNHGDSPHHASHSYIDLAADLTKLITSFSVEKGIIIGHSMGGKTGMTLALTEPSKVSSLIVVDISPVPAKDDTGDIFPKLLEVMQSVDFTGMDTLSKAKNAARKTILESGVIDNVHFVVFLLMSIGELPDKSFGWKYNVGALRKNYKTITKFPKFAAGIQYNGPTLFIGGALSEYMPAEDKPEIRRLFPNANIQYIDDAGHNVHTEQPRAFFVAVMKFLSSLQTQFKA